MNIFYVQNNAIKRGNTMKLAIIGSRGLVVEDLGEYVSPQVTEIVSGGAQGIDRCAREYALGQGLRLTEFLPDYARYGRAAPIRRNEQIVQYADEVLAFWDGQSAGTQYTIRLCERLGKPMRIVRL